MHGPLLLKVARVLQIRQDNDKWFSNGRQKLIQLGQGTQISNDGLAFGPVQHHLRSLDRKHPVQGNITMSSQQGTQDSSKCNRTAVSKNSRERCTRVLSPQLNCGRNAAGQLAQLAVTQRFSLDDYG